MARVFLLLAVAAFAGYSQAATSSLLNMNAVLGADVVPKEMSLVGSVQNVLSILTNDDVMTTVMQNFLTKVGSVKGEITDDLAERTENLKQNIATIIDSNTDGLRTFTMGLNKFSDMGKAEFKSKYANAQPEASGNGTNNEEAQLGNSRNKRQAADCPAAKNWTAEGMVTPVRDQGQCGSCYAFGSVATLEAAYAIQCGINNLDLSEQNLMDCSKPNGNNGCEGGNAVNSLTFFQQAGGLALESVYPYTTKTGATCQSASSKTGKVNAFNRVSPLNDEQALKCEVAKGPVAVMVNADGWSQYKGGVFGVPKITAATTTTTTTTTTPKPTTKKSFFGSMVSIAALPLTVPLSIIANTASAANGAFNNAAITTPSALCLSEAGKADHLVLVTGYGTENINGKDVDYWSIKNSWGPNWGENGYIRIKRGENACGVANNPYEITNVQC